MANPKFNSSTDIIVEYPTEDEWLLLLKNNGKIGLGLKVVDIAKSSYGKVANDLI